MQRRVRPATARYRQRHPTPEDLDPRVHVKAHQGLADAAASRCPVWRATWEDRVQEAWVAILEARESWDGSRGAWGPWAARRIRHALWHMGVASFRMTHFGGVNAHTMAFQRHRKGAPTPMEPDAIRALYRDARARMAQGMSDADLRALDRYALSPDLWLDDPEESVAADELPGDSDPEAALCAREEADAWGALLQELLTEAEAAQEADLAEVKGAGPRMDQDIIRRRLWVNEDEGEPDTLRAIGDRYGLSRERVRQREARLLWILTDRARKAGLLPPSAARG